jgi:hypothetical protein
MGGNHECNGIYTFSLIPKIKISRCMNPKVFLVKLRDEYVKMMLNSSVFSNYLMHGGFKP